MKVEPGRPPPSVPQVVRRVRAGQEAQAANDQEDHPRFPVAFPTQAKQGTGGNKNEQVSSPPGETARATSRPRKRGPPRCESGQGAPREPPDPPPPRTPNEFTTAPHWSARLPTPRQKCPTAPSLLPRSTYQKWRAPSNRKVTPVANSSAAMAMVRHGSRCRPPGSAPEDSAAGAAAPKTSVPLKRRPSTTYWSADGASSPRDCRARQEGTTESMGRKNQAATAGRPNEQQGGGKRGKEFETSAGRTGLQSKRGAPAVNPTLQTAPKRDGPGGRQRKN